MFDYLSHAQIFLKEPKCRFAQQQIEFLGHIMAACDVTPDPSKIEAMVNWPTPTTPQSLRGFLGLIGFYRKFIREYVALATPLIALLQKDNFHWDPHTQLAFNQLKRAMTQALVLSLPDFSIPFTLKTDVSGTAMGVFLTQRGHPLAFFSKAFCPCLELASTYVRELHAITMAIRKWRQ